MGKLFVTASATNMLQQTELGYIRRWFRSVRSTSPSSSVSYTRSMKEDLWPQSFRCLVETSKITTFIR